MLLEAYFAQIDGILQKLSDVCICLLLLFKYLIYMQFKYFFTPFYAIQLYWLLILLPYQCGEKHEIISDYD